MVMSNSGKKKTTQGRKKIEIKKIEEVSNRQVTFSKRRAGLFKKASELCVLTGAQIAILVHSPGGRVFAFGHPTTDHLIDRYLHTSTAANAGAPLRPPPTKEFNQHYVEVSKELEAEKKRREMIQESKAVVTGGGARWYEEATDGLDLEELEQYVASLEELKKKVVTRADELMMIKKSPALLGSNIFDVGFMDYGNNVNIQNMQVPINAVPPFGLSFAHAGGDQQVHNY